MMAPQRGSQHPQGPASHRGPASLPPVYQPPGAGAPAPSQAPPALRAAAEKGPPPNRSWIKFVVLLVVAGLAYGAYYYRQRRLPYEWSGTVEAKNVQVGSRTGGRVKEVHVREGDQVRAGQVLVTLEAHDLLAQKAGAEAELAMAEAGLLKMQHGARREQIAEARARLAAQLAGASQAGLRAAHEAREVRRTKSMVDTGSLASAELDARRATADSAARETAQATARVGEAQAALGLLLGGTREEDLRIGEASVAAARARLSALGGAISELEIRAARDSIVETVNVRPGSLLPVNAPAVTLLEAGELYVRVYVPETLVGKIKIGQAVPISVDSFQNRTFRGKVEHVNAVGEYTPRNLTTIDDRANEVFAARVGLLDGQTELRAGMVAYIHVAK
jgi:HlyD family secretion protein